MSQLIKRLRQIAEGSTQRLGFRAGTASPTQSMLLIAALPHSNDDTLTEVVSAEVDAILLCMEDLESEAQSFQRIVTMASNIPWGVWSTGITNKSIGQLREAGGDFLIFEASAAPAALLQEKELGKVLKIAPPLDDSLMRTIERLPIDAMLIDIATERIKVSHLMYCQRLADLIPKPLLVAVSQELEDEEIQALRESGATGLVVEIGEKPRERLLELHQRIKALPSIQGRWKSRGAILPQIEPEEI